MEQKQKIQHCYVDLPSLMMFPKTCSLPSRQIWRVLVQSWSPHIHEASGCTRRSPSSPGVLLFPGSNDGGAPHHGSDLGAAFHSSDLRKPLLEQVSEGEPDESLTAMAQYYLTRFTNESNSSEEERRELAWPHLVRAADLGRHQPLAHPEMYGACEIRAMGGAISGGKGLSQPWGHSFGWKVESWRTQVAALSGWSPAVDGFILLFLGATVICWHMST